MAAGFGNDRIEFDDAIAVDVQEARGTIAGANPRSVLLGVYRFLTEVGCRWVRPGAEGELQVHPMPVPGAVVVKARPRTRWK